VKNNESHWRRVAAPIIAAVLEKYPVPSADQEKALREAYPFGERKYHPYKIWLNEIKQQKGGRRVVVLDERKLVFGSRVDPFGEGRR